MKDRGSRISRDILMAKAEDFGRHLGREFKATDGWLTRWESRHGIRCINLYGEAIDSDRHAADTRLRTSWPELVEYINHGTYSMQTRLLCTFAVYQIEHLLLVTYD
jgi:hypothetical protein